MVKKIVPRRMRLHPILHLLLLQQTNERYGDGAHMKHVLYTNTLDNGVKVGDY